MVLNYFPKIAIMREIQSGGAGMENNTLAFCFGDGNISYLNFDESVSEETAKELIEKIKQFLERNRIR